MNKNILKQPVITEKSLGLANQRNVYTFAVDRHASKDQIKIAIEQLYGVKVLAVNTVMRQGDLQRTGKRRLMTKIAKTKKALVTLQTGQTIELFDISK